MSNLLKKPKKGNSDNKDRYHPLNLKDNPFPSTPYVNRNNSDDRYNGNIYEARIREKEYSEIVNNFLKVPQSDPNHIRLGYILDSSYVGRGNGKSAFALNLINNINKEYCLDISKEENKCFGLLITPETGGKTKTFVGFVDLLFESILDNNIIDYCLASLRLDAIVQVYKDKVNIEKDFEGKNIIEELNGGEWFQEKNFEVAKITNEIFKHPELGRLATGFPLSRDKNMFYNHRVINQKDFADYYNSLKKPKEKLSFIFNDLVLFFQASSFNGAYIIIDDFERIPDFQSEKLKQEFALEIRTNFFDGIYENAKIGFYNLLLVLHAGVPRLVEKAWSVSGMVRRSPMLSEVASKHIISFDKLNIEHSELLLKKYLDMYRLDANDKDEFKPFTKDVIGMLSEKSELNASTILEKSHMLIEEAIKEGREIINADFFNEKFGKVTEIKEEDISQEDSTDLFDKAKSKDS